MWSLIEASCFCLNWFLNFHIVLCDCNVRWRRGGRWIIHKLHFRLWKQTGEYFLMPLQPPGNAAVSSGWHINSNIRINFRARGTRLPADDYIRWRSYDKNRRAWYGWELSSAQLSPLEGIWIRIITLAHFFHSGCPLAVTSINWLPWQKNSPTGRFPESMHYLARLQGEKESIQLPKTPLFLEVLTPNGSPAKSVRTAAIFLRLKMSKCSKLS